MSPTTPRIGALVAAAALVLAGCGGSADDDDTASTTETIKLGMVPGGNFNSLAPIVAEAEGFFADQGLEVEVIDMAGGPQMVSAIASGGIDVMLNSPANGMIANAAGQQLVGVVAGFKTPAYTWIAAEDWPTPNADAGFPDVAKDFKGATVGVPVLASEIENVTRALAKDAGLDPDKDLKYVAIGAGAQAIGAFEADQVDIFVATEPGPTVLLDRTKPAKSMIDLRDPDDRPESLQGWTSVVYQANKQNADDNPTKFEKFAAGIAAANEFITSDREGAIAAYANSLDMDEETRGKIYDANVGSITSTVDCANFPKMADFVIGAGLLPEDKRQDCSTFMWSGSAKYQTN